MSTSIQVPRSVISNIRGEFLKDGLLLSFERWIAMKYNIAAMSEPDGIWSSYYDVVFSTDAEMLQFKLTYMGEDDSRIVLGR